MIYRNFGKGGLRVSELALGTGNFGTGWGHGSDKATSRAMFDRYVEAGGNFIDTADEYQGGESEEMLGEFIAPSRDSLVVASKYTMAGKSISELGNSRKNMVRSLEASLRRLKTEHIDLYWVHFPDGSTPVEEILSGFDSLVRAGKILYAGFSNFPAWRVGRAELMAEMRGWAPVTGLQVEYSLVERSPERELLPMAEALGLGVALWSPLGGGVLSGKYRRGEQGRLQGLGTLVRTEKSERDTATVDEVLQIAEETDATPSAVAVAWLLQRARRSPSGMVTILGPRTLEQLDGTLAALEVKLSAQQVDRLDAVSAVSLGTPHDQVSQFAAGLLGGRTVLPRAVPVA